MENCFHRTLGDASLAIDALVGVDVQHLLPFVETLDRANHHTVRVFTAEAGLGDYMGHGKVS